MSYLIRTKTCEIVGPVRGGAGPVRDPAGLPQPPWSLSEDIDPNTRELWGNFAQTYSMVGLINSAMRLSKPWEEAF